MESTFIARSELTRRSDEGDDGLLSQQPMTMLTSATLPRDEENVFDGLG
jgi:hypothetical protein